jgi:hypothetical protein
MVTRLRIAGVTLAVRARKALPGLLLPKALGPFSARRGEDIDLTVVRREPPPPGPLVFDSGGAWRVFRRGRQVQYSFPAMPGDGARAVFIDGLRRRGRLYLPPSRGDRRPGLALGYPLDELLFQHHLAHAGALVVHACGVTLGGGVILFSGPSGAGKTTMARLWRKHAPKGVVLSDDRMVVRWVRGCPWAFGTPWHGSGQYASPRGASLRALFFLRRSRRHFVRRLAPARAGAELFTRCFPPLWEARGVSAVLQTCARLVKALPCYEIALSAQGSPLGLVQEALDEAERGTPLASSPSRNR